MIRRNDFSNEIVCSPPMLGAHVKLSAKKLKDQGVADAADSVLAMCHADDTLVGHAFARVWKYDGMGACLSLRST